MGFEQRVDQWREFYLAVAGGAAAVLLGLVFVALSLHLEKAEAPGIPVLGLYLLAAGSVALIASATRSTWTQLLFGRTQSLE